MTSRVTASPDAIYGAPRRCRARRRCDGHLTSPHWIEVGDELVPSAMPPHSEFGNLRWLHAWFCAECWPERIPS